MNNMNNMNIADFEKKVNFLLTKRKMMPSKKIGLKAWCKYFMAFAWTEHCKCGDGHEMLDILLNEDNLIGGEKFNTTFILKFEDLYPEALKNNKTWQRLLPALVGFKGKGLGVGELYLALVIQGWTFERTGGKGDGKVAGGIRELKNNGASLKPLANAVRVQDQLNLTVFEGHRAGPTKETKRTKGQCFSKWLSWFDTNTNKKEILLTYFTQLYPGRDVTTLVSELLTKRSADDFYRTIGKSVLAWYKEVDNWDSLVIIDQDKMKMVNIADTDDLSLFSILKFDWKSERGHDSQAISDGYVNISI
jgi:hypothetical protein